MSPLTTKRRTFGWHRGLSIPIALFVAVFVTASPTMARIPGPDAIQRLEDAIKIHPQDPDLAWALARKLAGSGRGADALRETRSFIARWPERRPDARLEIARSLLDAGRSADATILLDEELRQNPRSAVARFYRGLAFRAEGQLIESNREFAFAGRLAPALRPESLLAQALGLFELGQEDEAVDLLRQILQLAPTSESAIRARLMLRQREVLSLQRPLRLDAHVGFEWDENVLLESATSESVSRNRSDVRGIWGAGATLRALTSDTGSLTLGYRFDQSVHHDLNRFDLLTNSGFLSGSLQIDEDTLLRFDALAWNTRQDGDNELTGGTLRPNFILSFGEDHGVLRAFVQYEVFEYHSNPALEVLEQDGFSVGGGLEYFAPLPFENSLLATSISYQRNLTQADPVSGTGGFDGEFDYDSIKLRSRALFRLPGEIRATVEVGYSHDQYLNDNFLFAFSTLKTRKREDDIASARIELRRQIIPRVEVEAYWRGTWRMSNVSFFDYDQQVVCALLRVSTE